jgi:small GTP-binding protein
MTDIDKISISLPLAEHPLNKIKESARIEYIYILRQLVERFSNDDTWANAAIAEYCHHFLSCGLSGNVTFDLAKSIKRITANHIFVKQFSKSTLRRIFVCDVLLLTSFGDEKTAKLVCKYLAPFLHIRKRHKKDILALIAVLFDAESQTGRFRSVDYLVDCWHKNMKFIRQPLKRILVTATVSAGKSTLINAMIGSDVFESRNAVCTNSVQRVYNKAFQDNVSLRIKNNISLYADSFVGNRICFIDTPGVNSARDPPHRAITEHEISIGQYDVLLYILNATQLGVNDDETHLRYVLEKKPTHVPLIFALNKLDNFDDDDSVEESISRLRNALIKYGMFNAVICPVSAKVGRIAKKVINGVMLNNRESRLYSAYLEEFVSPKLNLSIYYSCLTTNILKTQLLELCGISGLEQTLSCT